MPGSVARARTNSTDTFSSQGLGLEDATVTTTTTAASAASASAVKANASLTTTTLTTTPHLPRPRKQVLHVLFSAPLAWRDRSSRLHPLEMLDYATERDALYHVFREVQRDVSVRFDFATTDSLVSPRLITFPSSYYFSLLLLSSSPPVFLLSYCFPLLS